jgi:DNA invertase Pin-like site-specific DNA recombinase
VSVAILVALGLTAIVAWLCAELRRARLADEHCAQLTALTPPPPSALVSVIGYVALARGADRDLDTAAQTIGSWCEGRGWQLTQVVHEVEPASGRIADRPGLRHALDRIAEGRVAGLVVAHLGHLAGSVTELAQLLRWLNEAEAFVIALDDEPDASTEASDLVSSALMAIAEWEREEIAGRTEPGLPAMRASVGEHPELGGNAKARWDADPS